MQSGPQTGGSRDKAMAESRVNPPRKKRGSTMKRWVELLFLVPGLLSGLATVARADDPPKPIRALLVLGGCCHDYAHQKDILTRGISQRAAVEWTVAYDPNTSNGHKNPLYNNPDWAKGFDVVVHDECSSHVNDMASIDTILKPHKEGLPGVVLHCAMHCYRTDGWNQKIATPWMQFTGLISTGHGPQQPIAVTYVDRESPITKPLADWTTVNEELYNNARRQARADGACARARQAGSMSKRSWPGPTPSTARPGFSARPWAITPRPSPTRVISTS